MKKAVIQLALCLIMMLIPLNAVSEEEYRFPPIVEGLNFVSGMDPSGHVIAVGDNSYGQCNVDDWEDVVSIAAGFEHLIGLRADGTILFAGSNDYGQGNVGHWEHIKMIAADPYYSFGLTQDGKILCSGRGIPQEDIDRITSWTDIEWISDTGWGICAIDTSGHIHTVNDTDCYTQETYDYDYPDDVQQAYAIPFGFIALLSDGTIFDRESDYNLNKEKKASLVGSYEGYVVILYEDGNVDVTQARPNVQEEWSDIAWTNGHFAITREGTYVSVYCSEPKEEMQDILEDFISHKIEEYGIL